MKNNTLNKLKSDYEELEIKPSADLWNKLDRKLDDLPETDLEPSFQWWKYAAVVLLLFSVGMITYFNINKNKFNAKEKDYAVTKIPENKGYLINPEFENQNIKSTVESGKTHVIKTVVVSKKNKIENEITHFHIPEFKTPQITVKQDIDVAPVEIKNTIINPPVIAEAKKAKPMYINSNELLLGREFDQTRENPYKNDIKFGVFNFDKPKVENVTVLGVSVYIDSK